MQLSKKILPVISEKVLSPVPALFELPEKVLQFGTGVLLRGLPDYFIDKANKQDLFNGRIVLVKSTDNDGADVFHDQDGLYTHCIRGIIEQKMMQEFIINGSISRVLSAKSQWQQILKCAADRNLEMIISNTTEVGLILKEDENILGNPPISFPGKILAYLFERYKYFRGNVHKGLVIIPTELTTDNGDKLLQIVLQLAELNKMEQRFIDWLEIANCFCNSLVDRIVPGKLPAEEHLAAEIALGYSDELMIISEIYSLWAIETSSYKTKEILSFAKVNDTVFLANNIYKHRELKLRLLNGAHTFYCALSYLADVDTVKEAMNNKLLEKFIVHIMKEEIGLCISGETITAAKAEEFSDKVIERFRNPFINHKWLSVNEN